MLRLRTFALAIGLTVALASVAPLSRAQVPLGPGGMAGGMPPGAGMGMMTGGQGTSPLLVILAPSVQKELKLTDEQKSKVYAFTKTATQKNRDLMQTIAFGGNGNPQAMMEAGMKIRQDIDQGIAGILDAKQKERFDQISLQAEGPLAVARPEIAAKLRLNDTQQEYVQGIMMQMRRELMMSIRQAAAAGQFSPSQTRALSSQLRKDAVKQIAQVIDKKQQKTFNGMLGAPFDVAKLESETAAADGAIAPPDSTKPADGEPSQTKDASTANPEPAKDAAKATTPPARKKGRTRTGANP